MSQVWGLSGLELVGIRLLCQYVVPWSVPEQDLFLMMADFVQRLQSQQPIQITLSTGSIK